MHSPFRCVRGGLVVVARAYPFPVRGDNGTTGIVIVETYEVP